MSNAGDIVRDYKYSLDIMKQELENKYISPEVLYAFKASIEALEKQAPKKIVENYYEEFDCGELYDKGYVYNCPNCGNEVGAKSLEFEEIFWETNYCCECGQKLDWD